MDGPQPSKVSEAMRRVPNGRPPALEGERGDEASPVDLGPRQERGAGGAEGGVEVGAKRRPGDGQQQGHPLQRAEADLARTCERVVDGYDQDEILLEKGGQREVASRRRKVEHGEVDLSRCELDIELGACQFDEYQVKVGVSLGDRA